MKITFQNNYNSAISRKNTAFRSASGDFGKAVNDFFVKEKVSPEMEVSLVDKLKLALKEITKRENYMGQGFFSTVYKIDDNFVMKVRNFSCPEKETENPKIKKGKEIFKRLKTYYGEPVLEIGALRILRNLGSHVPASVPPAKLKELKSIDALTYYQAEYLPLFAKIPQKSYNAVAKDFGRLNNMKYSEGKYYTFDSKNPANIVLIGDKLKLVDELNTVQITGTNSAGKLLELLLFKISTNDSIKSYGENLNDAREIFRKVIIASEKAHLPYDTTERDRIVWKGVLENLKIKTDIDEFIGNMEAIGGRNPKLSDKILEIEKYIDSVMKY